MASSENFPAGMCLSTRDTYMKLSTIVRWKNVATEFMNQEYELQSGSVPDITHNYLIVQINWKIYRYFYGGSFSSFDSY
jgi:hypothetical protein